MTSKAFDNQFVWPKDANRCPSGGAPGEVWWLLGHPNNVSNARFVPRGKYGVGHKEPEPLDAKEFWWYMFSFCVAVRRRRRVPLLWNASAAAQVPKLGKTQRFPTSANEIV